MLSCEEMNYLTAFAKSKTLSEVAEQFHISQPTITRTRKKAEEVFGVSLFDRTKNSIKLNENGKLAAVQLPKLVQLLTECYPEKAISTELRKPDELLTGLKQGIYQLIILPFVPKDSDYHTVKIEEEHLMFYLPKKHHYSKSKALSLQDMNGENMLLFSDIGFWSDLVRRKMPDSRFLVQNERYTFQELISNSILPCFVSDLSLKQDNQQYDRIPIPITDPEVNVTYYLVYEKNAASQFQALLKRL